MCVSRDSNPVNDMLEARKGAGETIPGMILNERPEFLGCWGKILSPIAVNLFIQDSLHIEPNSLIMQEQVLKLLIHTHLLNDLYS